MGIKHRKYTKELLEPLASQVFTISDLLRALGIRLCGGNHRTISTALKHYRIDTSHFKGASVMRGETAETSERVRRQVGRIRKTDEEVFVKFSNLIGGNKLAKRLRRKGRKYECENGHPAEWMGYFALGPQRWRLVE